MHTQSSNAFGVMDNDDWFSFLGGLSLAVKMVEEKPEGTKVTVLGSSWVIIAIVIGLIGLLAAGWRKQI